MANTGEYVPEEPPTDLTWCPDCERDCSVIEDRGLGFELWREADYADSDFMPRGHEQRMFHGVVAIF